MTMKAPRLRQVTLLKERVRDWGGYPFNIPIVRSLSTIDLSRRVYSFVGENRSGKSTVLEAIAEHAQSHGQSLVALLEKRFFRQGFYLLDEPEAALSPQRQLSFLLGAPQPAKKQS